MASVEFEVVYSQWGAGEDEVFAGGVHVVEDPSAEFLKLLAGAEAAGSVVVHDIPAKARAALNKHVQSQEDGEKAQDKAMESGAWHHGNALQFVLDAEARLEDEDLSDADRAWLERGIETANALIAELEGGS